MARNDKLRRSRLLLGIVLGLLAFAAGAVPAGIFLPEWRTGQPLPEEVFRNRYAELAGRAGLTLAPGEPRIRLVTRDPVLYGAFYGTGGLEEGPCAKPPVRVEVFHEVEGPEPGRRGRLGIDLSLDGTPLSLAWWTPGMGSVFERRDPESDLRFGESLGSL